MNLSSQNIKPPVQEIYAATLEEARNKLFELYGPSYDLIDVKTVPKYGLFSFRKKEQVLAKYTVKNERAPIQGNDFLNQIAEQNKKQEDEEKALEKNRQEILSQQTSNLISAQLKEIEHLKNELGNLDEKMTRVMLATENPDKPESILKIENLLEDNDFSRDYIQMISDKIRTTFSMEQCSDFALIERTVIDWIGETIEIAPKKHYRPPHVLILVGPTGVGKTTTLVKLAAKSIKQARTEKRQYETRLITTDVTRVGALDQLEHFGQILEKNVIKAEKVDDLVEIFEQNKNHCDEIFIDTGGYSPNDSEHIGRLKAILNVPNLNPEILLAVDAKTKKRDIENIIQNYEPFAYNAIVVTKCDESGEIGNVISALYAKRKSVSYITDGQSAARNLSPANVVYFLQRLKGFNVDTDHIKVKFLNSEE